MKNLKYFPFERNKYFYGKLLSVDDFETEQKYMNDKRRMTNRFLHGTGVVCGLNVVLIDDKTISLEPGFALDFAGREIVIDAPVTKKLSMIEGFESIEDENGNYLYLCMDYMEKEKEPVHSIANTSAKGDNVEYNKYAECSHIYLTNQEPEDENLSTASFYEETKTIYWGNGIRIKQVVPKYAEGQGEFDLTIFIENMGQQLPIGFSYTMELSCLQIQGKNNVLVTFAEEEQEKAYQYELHYKVNVNSMQGVEGSIDIQPNSFVLRIGEKEVEGKAHCSSKVKLVKESIQNEILKNYYRGAMETIVQNTFQQSIYLAKIMVIHAGASYVIDSVEAMPFHQYVFNSDLASVFQQLAWNQKTKKIEEKSNKNYSNGTTEQGKQQKLAASGVEVIDLGIGGTAGKTFFSKEIIHGLGLGDVQIFVGIASTLREDSPIIFGKQDIFEDKQIEVKAETAVKIDITKGTFVIGIRCLEDTLARQAKIYWTALRDKTDVVIEKKKVTMHICPDMQDLSLRENYYFQAMIGDETSPRVEWSIKEPDGGTIDENGMYTSPNRAGVYEILAQSKDDPDLKASTFVVVR
ncbi:MAG: hypothetical protein RSB37_00620 [Acetivibrio sp.]